MGANRRYRSFRFRDWYAVLCATFYGIGKHHISLYAAGVAFYMLFSLFPALVTATWLLGLLADPAAITRETSYLRDILPEQAFNLVQDQLVALTSAPMTGLSLVAITNAAIALFTARTAVASMIEALNAIYEVEETRGIITINAIAIMFTGLAIVAMVLAIALVLVTPTILALTRLDTVMGYLIRFVRWPMLALLGIVGLAFVYRYGPNRKDVSWSWVTWGSVLATAVWLAVSIGFSWYVAEFNSYNRVYGSLGAVVILLFWFWLTAFTGLAGAQFDKAIEDHMARPAPDTVEATSPAALGERESESEASRSVTSRR